MDSRLQQLLAQFQAMSHWEYLAVVLAIAYLWLAMRQSLWCWPAAFISTLIYTLIFWNVALLSEALLQLYYLGMALYGFWLWRYHPGHAQQLPIRSWGWPRQLQLIASCSLASLLLGWLMAHYTHADYPYLDAATTCFAIANTWLVARKVLENWLYWLVIDGVSIYLYLAKGLDLTAALFALYLLMVIIGYWRWRQLWLQQQGEAKEHGPLAVA